MSGHSSPRDSSVNPEVMTDQRVVITSMHSLNVVGLPLKTIFFSNRIEGHRYCYRFQTNSCWILCQCTCRKRGISNVYQSCVVGWTNNGVRVDRSCLAVSTIVFGFLHHALERLPRPLDVSCTLQFQICTFFEPGPVFGRGILLRKFNIRLGTLMKYSDASFCASLKVWSTHNTETVVAISFLRKDIKVLSPCSSLEMTMKLVSPQEINAVAACVPTVVRRFFPSISNR